MINAFNPFNPQFSFVVGDLISRRDWPNLPWDLLFRIIESSFSLSDYIRFGSVCVQWRFFYLENYNRINELFSRRPPLLLYSPNPNEDRSLKRKREISTGSFYSLLDRKVYHVRFPSPCFNNFCGSSLGWLVTVDEEEPYAVRLLNPFSNRRRRRRSSSSATADAASNKVIHLPPLFQIHEYCSPYSVNYTNKVVLSGSPLSNPPKNSSFVAMALIRGMGWQFCPTDPLGFAFYPCGLGFCRPGDTAWTSLSFATEGKLFNDVVYYKGKFYAMENYGALISIDFGGCFPHSENEPKIVRIIDRPGGNFEQMYLLESSGDLLSVYQFNHKSFVRFEVFKLVGFTHWVKMKTLEDRILFLSNSCSMSLSSSDCPGFKPSYIYYATGYSSGQSSQIGVLNFENGSSELHDMEVMVPLPHAIWIQPTL